MKIVIAGGSGLVGTSLVTALVNRGDEVIVLTRSNQKTINHVNVTTVQWLSKGSQPEKYLQDVDVIINLAGASINRWRWTDKVKQRIMNSRIETTDALINIIKEMDHPPKVFINASAVGAYGTSLNKTFTEKSNIANEDFLATVVNEWESHALAAEQLGIRTVLVRIGLVLSRNGGVLPRLIFPYRLLMGGTIGSGKQWVSWIHIDDVVSLILFAIDNKFINGPINGTAPEPVQMKEFGKTLSQIIHRPHWLPIPEIVLKLLLGEMSLLLLKGQRVIPEKASESEFVFSYPSLKNALENLLEKA